MLFYDEKHEKFYMENCEKHKSLGKILDVYNETVIYLLGLCSDTRNHFEDLFDLKENVIIPSAISKAWQTGTSSKICRLALNLWNGYCGDDDMNNSKRYSVDDIFCCGYATFFFEAIRIRYPEYCRQTR